jgi:hypothetical protein
MSVQNKTAPGGADITKTICHLVSIRLEEVLGFGLRTLGSIGDSNQ